MAKLSFRAKPSIKSNIMTIKENYHHLQTRKYKKILIASGILNILLISYLVLTTIIS